MPRRAADSLLCMLDMFSLPAECFLRWCAKCPTSPRPRRPVSPYPVPVLLPITSPTHVTPRGNRRCAWPTRWSACSAPRGAAALRAHARSGRPRQQRQAPRPHFYKHTMVIYDTAGRSVQHRRMSSWVHAPRLAPPAKPTASAAFCTSAAGAAATAQCF